MERDLIWEDLDLKGLVSSMAPIVSLDEEIIVREQQQKNKNLSPTMKKHIKQWQKPTYNVLTGRYDAKPHKPVVINTKKLARLADPIRGKYSHLEKILGEDRIDNDHSNSKNDSYSSHNSPTKKSIRYPVDSSYDSSPNRETSNSYGNKVNKQVNGGFFLTETDTEVKPTNVHRYHVSEDSPKSNFSSPKSYNGVPSFLKKKINDAKKISNYSDSVLASAKNVPYATRQFNGNAMEASTIRARSKFTNNNRGNSKVVNKKPINEKATPKEPWTDTTTKAYEVSKNRRYGGGTSSTIRSILAERKSNRKEQYYNSKDNPVRSASNARSAARDRSSSTSRTRLDPVASSKIVDRSKIKSSNYGKVSNGAVNKKKGIANNGLQLVPVRNARESKIKKRTEKANLNDKNDKATSSKVKQNGNGRNSTNSSLVIGKTRESVSAGNLVLSRGNSLPKLDPIIEKSVSNNNIKIKKRTKSAASSAPHDLLKGLEKVDRDRIPFSQVSMRQFQSTLSPQSSPKHAQDNRQADGSYDANRSPKSNKKIQNNSIMNIKNTTRRGTDKDSTQIKNHDGDKKTDDSGNDVRAKTPHDDLETTMKKLEKYERYQKSDSSSNINTESDNYQQLFAKHAKKLNSHFVNAETHSSQYKTLAYGPESILSTLE